MKASIYEAKIHSVLDRISNNEHVDIEDEWIDQAAEAFKSCLKRQLTVDEDRDKFRVRMSNVGKPICQLKMEKSGAEKRRMPYNHVIRMLLGDATEAVMEVIVRAAGLNITGGKDKVQLQLGEYVIEGENDVEIDNEVYDYKSASPFAFDHKWRNGISGLRKDDSFGYIPQEIGYATALGKEPGGWIVVNKSSGEVVVVGADFDDEHKAKVLKDMEKTVKSVMEDEPFERCFEPEDEYFRKKPTGNKRLNILCTFCQFMGTCYPNAEYRPQAKSTAANPRHYWYAEYHEENND